MGSENWKQVQEYEDIRYEKLDEGIAKITINRPHVRNAFRPETTKELIDAIEAVAGGEVVRPAPDPSGASPRQERIAGVWPGREHGLSAREAEVVALITQGLSNDEIAKMTYLSINSVKTYIRGAYRKIGISRRSQAVIWGMQHGFEPDTARVLAAPPRG